MISFFEWIKINQFKKINLFNIKVELNNHSTTHSTFNNNDDDDDFTTTDSEEEMSEEDNDVMMRRMNKKEMDKHPYKLIIDKDSKIVIDNYNYTLMPYGFTTANEELKRVINANTLFIDNSNNNNNTINSSNTTINSNSNNTINTINSNYRMNKKRKSFKYNYTLISNLTQGIHYIYGIVINYKNRKKLNTGHYSNTFVIIDESCCYYNTTTTTNIDNNQSLQCNSQPLSITINLPIEESVPNFKYVGQIIRLHRINIKTFHGQLQGQVSPGFDYLIIDNNLDINNILQKKSFDMNFDLKRIDELQSFSKLFLSSFTDNLLNDNRNDDGNLNKIDKIDSLQKQLSINTITFEKVIDKSKLLIDNYLSNDLKKSLFFDIVCKITKLEIINNKEEEENDITFYYLYLTDGIFNGIIKIYLSNIIDYLNKEINLEKLLNNNTINDNTINEIWIKLRNVTTYKRSEWINQYLITLGFTQYSSIMFLQNNHYEINHLKSIYSNNNNLNNNIDTYYYHNNTNLLNTNLNNTNLNNEIVNNNEMIIGSKVFYENAPFTTIMEIIQNSNPLNNKQLNNKIMIPYKYRSKVKVIDYFPKQYENFTYLKNNEYKYLFQLKLIDYNVNNNTIQNNNTIVKYTTTKKNTTNINTTNNNNNNTIIVFLYEKEGENFLQIPPCNLKENDVSKNLIKKKMEKLMNNNLILDICLVSYYHVKKRNEIRYRIVDTILTID
ncbi:hypothetical protein ABK040_014627 [Willaertia magna]